MLSRMGCLNVKADRIGNGLDVVSNRIGNGLNVQCGIVCSLNYAKYLKVKPQAIFLMKANNYMEEVCIISNVEWHIS